MQLIGNASCFNGGAIAIGTSTQATYAAFTTDAAEWVNGINNPAIDGYNGGRVQIIGQQYGFGNTYSIGIQLASGAHATVTAESQLAIPATQQLVMAGNNLNYSAVPINYPNSDCSFVLTTDANSTANLAIAGQAQGDILYFNGTSWSLLPPGIDGYALTTHGASANPSWTEIAGGGGTITSVFSRTGPAIVSATNDYTSTQIQNLSAVSGTGVTGALNTLNTGLATTNTTVSGLVTGVSTVFGRGNAVTAQTNDYTSTQITNSSGVSGTGVTGALNTLNTSITALVARLALPTTAVNGQALIWDGSWLAGGGGDSGDNYYWGQNLVTDGYVQTSTLKPRAGVLTVGDGTTDITYNSDNINSASHHFQLAGTDAMTIGIGGVTINRTLLTFGGGTSTINLGTTSSSGSLPNLTIQAKTGNGSGTFTGGVLALQGGNANSGSGTGGDVNILAGTGAVVHGNISLGSFSPNWQGMGNGVFIALGTAVPTGNPTGGFFLYADPSDNKLKALGPSGTLTTIALP